MENERVESSFWNFSDQLRLHTVGIGSVSLGDSIWSDPFISGSGRRPEDRRTTEFLDDAMDREFGVMGALKTGLELPQKLAFTNSSMNRFNNPSNIIGSNIAKKFIGFNNNRGANDHKGEINNYISKAIARPVGNKNSGSIVGSGDYGSSDKIGTIKKNLNNKDSKDISINSGNSSGNSMDKRFKTLPPSEALPRNQSVGGYIFVCNNETMEENLRRKLFGLPPRYRDSVRAITPGLPIFLYNYSTHQLHGIFEATSFGGTNIDPTAWEDKKHQGESRFPAQVRVITRKNFKPLDEDSFRPILHHYDGPKFRLELSVPEALALLDVFAENDA